MAIQERNPDELSGLAYAELDDLVHHRYEAPLLLVQDIESGEDALNVVGFSFFGGSVVFTDDRLSERHRTVAALLAAGLEVEDISAMLGISVNTVNTHSRIAYDRIFDDQSAVPRRTQYGIVRALLTEDRKGDPLAVMGTHASATPFERFTPRIFDMLHAACIGEKREDTAKKYHMVGAGVSMALGRAAKRVGVHSIPLLTNTIPLL